VRAFPAQAPDRQATPVDVRTPAAAPQLAHQTLTDAGKSACESERRYLPCPASRWLLSGQA
jgi:hypothetical protein